MRHVVLVHIMRAPHMPGLVPRSVFGKRAVKGLSKAFNTLVAPRSRAVTMTQVCDRGSSCLSQDLISCSGRAHAYVDSTLSFGRRRTALFGSPGVARCGPHDSVSPSGATRFDPVHKRDPRRSEPDPDPEAWCPDRRQSFGRSLRHPCRRKAQEEEDSQTPPRRVSGLEALE